MATDCSQFPDRSHLSRPVICIVGPTASGKSELAQRIARSLDGEVVSADSMQIYRGMDIGTGKVMPADRIVAHYGLDLVDPGEAFSAALFQEYARNQIADIDRRGKRAVLCGGTGFYVRAVIDNYEFPAGEQVDNPVREQYLQMAAEKGAQAVWDALDRVDPESAALISVNDVKRVIRALELYGEGESYAVQKRRLASIAPYYPVTMIGIRVDTAHLNERIDKRVDAMVESGLVREVEHLLDRGFREAITANQAIGYKEIVAALDGEISLDEAVESIKISTHRYAKRQRTWFRKDPRIHWIDGTSVDIDRLVERACALIATIEDKQE